MKDFIVKSLLLQVEMKTKLTSDQLMAYLASVLGTGRQSDFSGGWQPLYDR